MAKQQRPAPSLPPTLAPGGPADSELPAAKPAPHPSARGGRETVDALAVAVVLALLIRTFQAEAFVIPTGSMAPTLMGLHKDVYCDECNTRYKVNASDEQGDFAEQLRSEVRSGRMSASQANSELRRLDCVGGTCPNCRRTMPFRSDGLEQTLPAGSSPVSEQPSFRGDQLIVSKYAYSFANPQRWDVAVFKYPGKATQNYIKRLVGLPGEKLRLHQGDLFIADEAGDYVIERKPEKQVLSMRTLVHDSDAEPVTLRKAGWPARWSADGDGWTIDEQATGTVVRQRFVSNPQGDATAWLRYRHAPPTDSVWQEALAGAKVDPALAKPSLVTDFLPYNTRQQRGRVEGVGRLSTTPFDEGDLRKVGLHWAPDLVLEARVQIEQSAGSLILELVEAGVHYSVEFDLAKREATLLQRGFEADADTRLDSAPCDALGSGEHTLRFANVDDQLLVWVDAALLPLDGRYDGGTTLEERARRIPRTSGSDPGDLAPAAVGARGAKVAVENLSLWRDLYYIATDWKRTTGAFPTDYDVASLRDRYGAQGWARPLLTLASTRDDWGLLAERQHADFALEDDQFFALGDNSAESCDARLWPAGNGRDSGRPGGAYLERDQIVGKAICVIWPHPWYHLPFTGGWVPVWPNFGDMRPVR
jgi:signal peptidase I